MEKNRIDSLVLASLQDRVAAGDQSAFESLYRLFAPRLFNFAFIYIHRKETAEEVVQDVMTKLWLKRNELREIKDLESYLFIAAKNHCLNILSKFSPYHVSLSWPEETAEIVNMHDPAIQLEWKETVFRLNQAIDALPQQSRTVFKMIKEEGFKYKQVAEILGISPRTVETQLFRAIKKLDEAIKIYRDQPEKKKDQGLPCLTIPILLLGSLLEFLKLL